MGGSGGRSYSNDEDVTKIRQEIHEQLHRQEIDAELNGYLATELAGFNDRDIQLVADRLDVIVEALGGDALDVDRLLFGGSVAKHTYVDGLSDIDALVVVDAPNAAPAELVGRFRDALSQRLGRGEILTVEQGNLAVTVTYRGGSQVQLLPAVERDGHTSITSEDGTSWRQIRPHKFAEKLTAVNQANGRAVVPTIKLAKAAIAGSPAGYQLSGYHVEAIAVDAFKAYDGRRDRVSMLRHLIRHAEKAVMRPTGDITGQSVNIDAHLGGVGSPERQAVSASLRRLGAQLDSATGSQDYRRIFDD